MRVVAQHVGAHDGVRSGQRGDDAGHGGDEIDVENLQLTAERQEHIADGVVRYWLPDGVAVTLLGDGHPLNIVLNSGSPEPVLLHFDVLGLTLEWLASSPEGLFPGEILVPEELEVRAAQAALAALASSRG